MLFSPLKWQQPSQPCPPEHGNPHNPSALGLLRLLPGLLLLTSSPALAQLSEIRDIQSHGIPTATVSPEIDTAFSGLPGPDAVESADLSLTFPSALEQGDSFSEQLQAKANLDFPPSPEIAATLCEGTAQSLSSQLVITSQTVCQSGLTPPSLWWTKEQVDQELRTSGKLVNDWSAQLKTPEAPGQVRLVVNPQMWSLMDYFERYDFVSNFGLAARSFGYQTEIYNTKGTRLASYVCQVQETPENLGSNCRMNLGSSLNFGSRGSRKSFL